GPRPPLGVGRHQSASRTMITCPKPDVPDISAGYATKSRNKEFRAGKALCPGGKSLRLTRSLGMNVNPSCEKYFPSVFRKNVIISPHPESARGTYRDRHGRWMRDAMDARVFSAACRADENIARGRAKSCGPDAPTLASTPGSRARGDGG